jgi:hypothetical protein
MKSTAKIRRTSWTLAAAVLALCSAAPSAHAQGSRKDDIVFGPAGHPVAGATIRVCQPSATGTPCSPLATIYTDATLTVTAQNPFQADGIGNYHFYAPAGRYQIQVSGQGIAGTVTYPDVILAADLSSQGSGNNISAFGLALGGNLSVAGNAAVSGTLSAGNFNPSSFSPSTLSVGGNENVGGPRPRVDVTEYGAKGDGATDDTAAIQSAITFACANGGSVYFPPGNYHVQQPQLPSTSPIFSVPCGNLHLFGGHHRMADAQFNRAPTALIQVVPGAAPNAAAAFYLQYPVQGVTFENLEINGYNRAMEVWHSVLTTLKNVMLVTPCTATGLADNTPLKVTNDFWFTMQGGGLQSACGGAQPSAIFTADPPLPDGEDTLDGLVYISDILVNGGGFQYLQRANATATGPGNFVFRNITNENPATDFFSIQNLTGNSGGAAMAMFTSVTFDHVGQSDGVLNTAALINFNSAGSVLSGVTINHSFAPGAAIRMTAGTLRDYHILGCDWVCSTAVVNASGQPVGDGMTQNYKGFDYITDTTDSDRLRNDIFYNNESDRDGTPVRLTPSGSQFASLALDPAQGLLFSDGASYAFNAQLYQPTKNTIDVGFASVLPPTNVAGTPTTGGTLAAGTYYYFIRSCTVAYTCGGYSAPSLPSPGVVVGGSNNAVSLTWTAASSGVGAAVGYVILRSTTPAFAAPAAQYQAVYVSGQSTTSFTDTGDNLGCCNQTPPYANLQSVHRFTNTSLGVNTTNPQFNLDVNGTAAVNSLNNVPKAERFPGADASAKLNACLAAAAASSGACDARGMTGTLTGSTHVTIPAGTTLLWGQGQLTISDSVTNDAIELAGDGASLYGYQETGSGTVSNPDSSGFIACGLAGCTTIKKPNPATSKINYVHINGMFLLATGASSKVLDLTSIGHSDIENNNFNLGTGGNSYGVFGNSSTGDFDATNSLIKHNNFVPQSAGDSCVSLTGIYNAIVLEQNTCILPHVGAGVYGYVLNADTYGNYPNNDEIYGNDCESASASYGQVCFNIIAALSVTIGPNNRCEKVYSCIQFPSNGSAGGIHLLDPYLSISNTNQVQPNEPATTSIAIDNEGHNWLPSMHYGFNDLSGPNLLGNAGFEGWQNSTTLFYWGGASGISINQPASGIYAQQASSAAPADGYTQGSYNLRVGDGATAGLGVNSACIQVDSTMEYTLAFRVVGAQATNNFRPGFRFYWDANCTEADRITSNSANARVLAPANYAGTSTSTGNWQSTSASLTYNNGISCNCNVTGFDWQAPTAWMPTRNFAITFRVPNAYSLSTTITHSMRVFLLENTAAANNYVYFDDAILSQGPVSTDLRAAALPDSGNGGTVNGYANYNFAGTLSLQSNTANTGTLSHSITANRAWTLPDVSGPVVVQTGSVPANNDCAQFAVSGSVVSIKDSGSGCASQGALASWGLQHAGSGQSFASNAVKVWGIVIPYAVSYSHIDYNVGTLDSSSSDFYDVGLYGPCAVNASSCPLVTHIGAQNLTTTGYKQAGVTSGTIQPGTYWIAITGNATTAQVSTTSVSEWSACPSTNSSTVSSGGVLPSSIAIPTCSAPQWTGATVVSIGFE